VTVLSIAAIIATPVLVVLSSVFAETGDVWAHLSSTVLPRYVANSLLLLLGVGTGVSVLGVGTAWLVTMCRFPGQGMFEWGLLLPLAAPSYVLAYVYTDFLEYYGPVQTALRSLFGWDSLNDYWFPSVRSLGGAVLMLTLVLYPYVYLLSRVAFLEQSVRSLEASRSLGRGPWRSFFTVALPLARPAIIAGLALALMETLNDFGTVDFFGVETFTTGIYRTWFGMGNRAAASQLAACLMVFILVLILLERWSRRQARYYQSSSRFQSLSTYSLKGWRSLLAVVVCAVPIILGLLLPTMLLLRMTIRHWGRTINANFWDLGYHSLVLASVSALLAVAIALVMVYGMRLNSNWWMRLGVRISAMGYAVPGSVIAVGILIPTARFDNWVDGWMRSLAGVSTGLLITGSITALVLAYLVRFLAVALSTVESSLVKIRPSLDDAARSLGYSPLRTLVHVHAPLMWSGILTGVMIVFVDVMKELPATLVMRPFNFDTLAVQVYRYASDERLVEASAPALAILLVGLVPVIVLSVQISRSRSRTSTS
jgi:iron(III) transport system permease protein